MPVPYDAKNLQGQQILREILGSRNQVIRPNYKGGRDIFDVDTGRGVRYLKDGSMDSFLDPNNKIK